MLPLNHKENDISGKPMWKISSLINTFNEAVLLQYYFIGHFPKRTSSDTKKLTIDITITSKWFQIKHAPGHRPGDIVCMFLLISLLFYLPVLCQYLEKEHFIIFCVGLK